MPHSVALALARTAADVPSLALPAGKAKPADCEAAPGTPRRMAEPPSRLDSLQDLNSSCSDSSDSSDDEAPSMQRQRSGRNGSAADGLGAISAGAAAAAMRARGVKRNRSDPPLPRQPLQWMGCTCHWQRDAAAPKPQQVELANCSSSTNIAALEQDASPLPPLPPELSHLMPPGLAVVPAAEQQRLPPEAEAPLQRLHTELAHSQAAYNTVLRALHRKMQECESLTGVVRDLTAGRAKAAAGRSALQQRCMALLDDVARLGRVADLARRGQADSRAAAEAATTARLEAEGEAADARRQVAVLEEQNAALSATNKHLARRVATLERVAASGHMNSADAALLRPLATCRLAESY